MRTLEGGCSVPIGVESSYDHKTKKLLLKGIVVNVEGTMAIEDQQEVVVNDIREDSIKCGVLLAHKMIKDGAKKILDEINLERVIQQ